MIQSHSMTQLNNKPTRVTENSAKIIDHIYVTNPENITETEVPYISISDHYPVCLTRN